MVASDQGELDGTPNHIACDRRHRLGHFEDLVECSSGQKG